MVLHDLFHGGEPVATISPDKALRAVGALMKERNVGAVLVTEEDKLVGILTDRDIALAMLLGKASRDTPVKKVMQKKIRTVWADQGIFEVCQAFAGYKVRRLPVIDRKDKLVGIVSADDLTAMLARELFNISKALEPALHIKM